MTVRIPTSKDGKSSEVWTVDFRETGPALANKTMYLESPIKSRYSGLAVGIPGEVRGLEEAHSRWGSLSWARLVQPSVELAAGWKVSKELARRINVRFSVVSPSLVANLLSIESSGQNFDDRGPRLE